MYAKGVELLMVSIYDTHLDYSSRSPVPLPRCKEGGRELTPVGPGTSENEPSFVSGLERGSRTLPTQKQNLFDQIDEFRSR